MPTPEFRFARHFADLPDPRAGRTKKHRLDDTPVIALCAVICGADSFEEIERSAAARRDWRGRPLAPPHGIPSHATFNRVFAALDRRVFADRFARWMADLSAAAGRRATALDGKACRAAAAGTFSGCLHLVNARAAQNHPLLGQVAVADGPHEIAALPGLIRALDLKGAPVTIGAAGCQKEVVREIRAGGGDYLVTVKGDQPALRRAVPAALERAPEADFAGCDRHAATEGGHGRHAERYVTVLPDPEGLPEGRADVAAVVLVSRERAVAGKNTGAAHFYLTSLRARAAELAGYIRGHRGVENGLPWCPDVSFGEGANRTRGTNAGAHLGVIRGAAAALLKQGPGKGSTQAKRFNAALDESYPLRVLQGFTA